MGPENHRRLLILRAQVEAVKVGVVLQERQKLPLPPAVSRRVNGSGKLGREKWFVRANLPVRVPFQIAPVAFRQRDLQRLFNPSERCIRHKSIWAACPSQSRELLENGGVRVLARLCGFHLGELAPEGVARRGALNVRKQPDLFRQHCRFPHAVIERARGEIRGLLPIGGYLL